jgi:hypothetical protein
VSVCVRERDTHTETTETRAEQGERDARGADNTQGRVIPSPTEDSTPSVIQYTTNMP